MNTKYYLGNEYSTEIISTLAAQKENESTSGRSAKQKLMFFNFDFVNIIYSAPDRNSSQLLRVCHLIPTFFSTRSSRYSCILFLHTMI